MRQALCSPGARSVTSCPGPSPLEQQERSHCNKVLWTNTHAWLMKNSADRRSPGHDHHSRSKSKLPLRMADFSMHAS